MSKLYPVTLTEKMFELVLMQSKEVEKAIIGMGEYNFKEAYRCLEIKCDKWFMMSADQRQLSLECMPLDSKFVSMVDTGKVATKRMSIPADRCGISTISSELLEKTWDKAEKLLNTEGSLCKAPGMSDAMCVASSTGSRPHIVCKTKKGSLACDDSCIAWKSLKFCSHVLAVAEETGSFWLPIEEQRLQEVTRQLLHMTNQRVLAKKQVLQSVRGQL